MVGQIGPLVQAGAKNRILPLHVFGGLIGGVLAGFWLGFAGSLTEIVVGGFHRALQVDFVVAALAYGGLLDVGLRMGPRVTVRRQTPGFWPCAFGERPALIAWGLDLGTMVSTRIPYQAALALPVAAFFLGDVGIAILLMAAYGASRALVVVLAVLLARGDVGRACTVIDQRAQLLSRLIGMTAILLSFVLLSST
jgi:hypothetical protein